MATSPESGGQKGNRISFLIPYIDFSFMLIIIFVGMLAIAYFDPQGSEQIRMREGQTVEGEYGETTTTAAGAAAPTTPGDAAGKGVPPPESIMPLVPKKGDAAGLSDKKKEELEQLRAEVERLQHELALSGEPGQGGPNEKMTGLRVEPGHLNGGAVTKRPGKETGGDPGQFDIESSTETGAPPPLSDKAIPDKPGGENAGDKMPGVEARGPDLGPQGNLGGPKTENLGGPEKGEEGGRAQGEHYFLDLR